MKAKDHLSDALVRVLHDEMHCANDIERLRNLIGRDSYLKKTPEQKQKLHNKLGEYERKLVIIQSRKTQILGLLERRRLADLGLHDRPEDQHTS